MIKGLLLIPALVVFGSVVAFAQVGVHVSAADTKENTTIEIKKGTSVTQDNKFEITDGTAQVDGDSSPLLKDARKNWKKACDEWKTELKSLNKESQILAMDCGSMNCSTVAMESTCKSSATYKLKVQVR